MEEDDEYRRRTMELLKDKCGFSFKEEDLSPSIRKEIGFLSHRLVEMDNFSLDSETKNKIVGDKRILSYFFYLISAVFFLYGVLFQFGSIVINLTFIIVSPIFILIGYTCHLSSKHDLEKFVAESLVSSRNTWDSDLKSLSDKIIEELKEVHEVKLHPTIRQEVIQYNISTKFEFGKNGALMIECPYCKASSQLASKINPVKCSYCGKEYIIPNKVLQML